MFAIDISLDATVTFFPSQSMYHDEIVFMWQLRFVKSMFFSHLCFSKLSLSSAFSPLKNVGWLHPEKCFKKMNVRNSSIKWTKALYQDYLHRTTNFCTTILNIFSLKKSFLTTLNVENKFWTSYETLERTGKLKRWCSNFTCLCILFFSHSSRKLLSVLFQATFLYLYS